jgi:hypothetical protein
MLPLCVAGAAACDAQTEAPARRSTAIPVGTTLLMATSKTLSTKTNLTGDEFDLAVVDDLVIDGHVLIPKGTRVVGELTRVSQKDVFGVAGKLEARFLYIVLDGAPVRLEGRLFLAGRQEIAGKSGTAASVGVIVTVGSLGGIVTGKSAVVPAGTVFSAIVEREATLSR